MDNNIFYVYEHWRLDKDECFYVGKGRGNRAYTRYNRNIHWKNIVNKLERMGFAYEVRFVKTGLSEDQAFSIEKERILFWRNLVDLANLTDGGEGASGRKLSEESINKLKKSKSNISQETLAKMKAYQSNRTEEHRNNIIKGKLGYKFSEESKKKMSEKAKGNTNKRGKKISDEQKQKISIANKGKVAWNKGVKATEESKLKMSISKIGNKNRLGGKKYLESQILPNGER